MNKSASLAKAAAAGAKGTPKAYDSQRVGAAPALLTVPKSYNADADVVAVKRKAEDGDDEAAKAARKAAKKAAKAAAAAAAAAGGEEEEEEERAPKQKKAKKDKK